MTTVYHLHPTLPAIKIKTHARARRLKLKIQTDGITLTIPPFTTQRHIQQFLTHQQDWLLKHWQAPVNIQHLSLFDYHQSCTKDIKIQYLEENSPYLYQYQAELSQVLLNPQKTQQALKKFILNYAQQQLPLILLEIAQLMCVHVSKISIRHAKSRWGSCSQHHAIMLNAYLVCCPPALIRYVCIHELAHTIHFNHSADFWAVVAQYDSNYQHHRTELKNIKIPF